ncbi:asparagine synthase-related protein [Candidatus Marithrix sp. Canyon 246]|uniref:asparagine synthase-related protein n=1 Tax=Candidatus Marithrix sp. Canyon 246 TaxID=1827136 RepID=UPI00084A2300|nr:asparagine synthetase B family protein [Candidatus Marithrix sp. Canyon 246]
MKNNNNYPVIFGKYSFKESSNKIFISQLGDSKEILQLKDETSQNKFILFGRVYTPIKVNHYEADINQKLQKLSKTDLKNLQGSFIHIKAINGTTLKISTDKYGFKPLFYYHHNNELYFATHLSGLKKLLNNKLPEISTDALLHYYNFGFTSNNQTLLEGIYKIPPGSTLTIENNSFKISPYFDLVDLYQPDKYQQYTEKELATTIDNYLLDSIKSQIPANSKAVGLSISGGVDSGYIAQKIVQCNVPLISYNLAYGDYYDEFSRVDFLAKNLNIEVKKLTLTAEQIINNFEQVNAFSSEPIGLNNATMRFVVKAAQQDNVTTLFDGDGADRLFLGMNRQLQYKKIINLYHILKKLQLLPIAQQFLKNIPNNEFKKLYINFQNWNNGLCPYPERDMGGLKKYDQQYEQKLYDLAIKNYRTQFETKFGTKEFGKFFTYQSILMCPEMFFSAPSEIQTQLQQFPVSAFWSDQMVSLALSLDTKWKLKKNTTKYILRKAAAKNLDPKYWMLPKIGLQNAYHYLNQSSQNWITEQRKKVQASDEYKILQNLLPNTEVQADKLISLIIWKQQNEITTHSTDN